MRYSLSAATGSLLLVLTACGGAASSATDAPTDGPSAVASSASAEPSPSGSDAAVDPGSTGSSDRYCLVTPAEVSEAMGVEVTSAEGVVNEGMGGGCMYFTADGSSAFAISVLDSSAAADAFDGYRQYEGAEEISGIGDAALFLPMNEMVGIAFKEGDVVASLGPTMATPDLSSDALRAAVEELARMAADRT